MARKRSPLSSPLPAFGPLAARCRLLRPLLTSALRSGRLTTASVPKTGTQRRPPKVRSTAFTARPPDLPPQPSMTVDFAISCSLVRPGRPRYPVFVHRAAALLHAFFRPHLAMTPLRFANPSPPSGWIEDFHVQAVVHTRHTTKRRPAGGRAAHKSPGSSRTLRSCHFAIDQRSLALGAVSIVQQRPAVTHHAMTGNSEGDRVVGAGLADRPERLGTRNATSQLREGEWPTRRNGAERLPDLALEGRSADIERNIEPGVRRAQKMQDIEHIFLHGALVAD